MFLTLHATEQGALGIYKKPFMLIDYQYPEQGKPRPTAPERLLSLECRIFSGAVTWSSLKKTNRMVRDFKVIACDLVKLVWDMIRKQAR